MAESHGGGGMSARACPDHGHHGPGRLASWRTCCSRRATRSTAWSGAPRPRSSSASSTCSDKRHAAPGRPARPPVADRHAALLATARGLQPRRDVVRRPVLDAADPHRRVHRRRRDPAAGGDPRGLPRGPLLPGLLERDVRQGARDAADREHAVLPALALRRGEGLRPPHHGQLPRVLRHVPDVGDPLQPRSPAPRPRVRDAQDHLARRRDQARASATSSRSATSTPSATGATRRTTSRRCG